MHKRQSIKYKAEYIEKSFIFCWHWNLNHRPSGSCLRDLSYWDLHLSDRLLGPFWWPALKALTKTPHMVIDNLTHCLDLQKSRCAIDLKPCATRTTHGQVLYAPFGISTATCLRVQALFSLEIMNFVAIFGSLAFDHTSF